MMKQSKLIQIFICSALISSVTHLQGMGSENQNTQELTDLDLIRQATFQPLASKQRSIGEMVNLLKRVKNPKSLDNHSDSVYTALIWAATLDFTNVIHALIKAGANVDAPNNKGSTALMKGVRSNNPNAVRVLLDHGADKGLTNEDGKTADNLAMDYHNSIHLPDNPRNNKADEIKKMLSNFEIYKKNHPREFEAIEQEKKEAEKAMSLPASGKLTLAHIANSL